MTNFRPCTPSHHKRGNVINNSRCATISSATWSIPAVNAGKACFSAVAQLPAAGIH
jgi:hypothetical protein